MLAPHLTRARSLIKSQSEAFFALPPQEKLAIAHLNTSEPQRGFSCVGAENTARLYRKGVLNISNVEDLRDCRVC